MTNIRLLSGVLIVAFLLVVNIILAMVKTGLDGLERDDGSASFSDCTSQGTYEDCDNVGKTSFFSALADVSFNAFEGAPDIVNNVWLTLMGLLLTTAILLIVASWLPTTSA